MTFTGFDDRKYYCQLESKNGSSPRMFYSILVVIIPLTCIIGCYSAIYLNVKRGQKELLSLLGSNSNAENIRKKIEETNSQLFKMIMVICSCFVICIVPMMALGVIIRTVSSVSKAANWERAFDSSGGCKLYRKSLRLLFHEQELQRSFRSTSSN